MSKQTRYLIIIFLTLMYSELTIHAEGKEYVEDVKSKMLLYSQMNATCSYSVSTVVEDSLGGIAMTDSLFIYVEAPYHYISTVLFKKYLSKDYNIYVDNNAKTIHVLEKVNLPDSLSPDDQFQNIVQFFDVVQEIIDYKETDLERFYTFKGKGYPYHQVRLRLSKDYGLKSVEMDTDPLSGIRKISAVVSNWQVYEQSHIEKYLSEILYTTTRGEILPGTSCAEYNIINEMDKD